MKRDDIQIGSCLSRILLVVFHSIGRSMVRWSFADTKHLNTVLNMSFNFPRIHSVYRG